MFPLRNKLVMVLTLSLSGSVTRIDLSQIYDLIEGYARYKI
jgi:hypothetical protein